MSRNVRCLLALLMLTLFLGTGAAHALPSGGPSPDRAPGMLAALWSWVTSVVEAEVPFLRAYEADGGTPLPRPVVNGGGSDTDGGAYIDPNG